MMKHDHKTTEVSACFIIEKTVPQFLTPDEYNRLIRHTATTYLNREVLRYAHK